MTKLTSLTALGFELIDIERGSEIPHAHSDVLGGYTVYYLRKIGRPAQKHAIIQDHDKQIVSGRILAVEGDGDFHEAVFDGADVTVKPMERKIAQTLFNAIQRVLLSKRS